MASQRKTLNRSKPAKARLSRELVLSTALALVDAEGLESLTMRRLGQELGRTGPHESLPVCRQPRSPAGRGDRSGAR